MAGLTIRKAGAADVALPTLLEFHSPSAALTQTPVVGAARGTTWVVVSLVAATVAAASLIPIDKVVTSTGKIVAQTPTSVVQPLETAIVRQVSVKEGQVVRKGDLLARLDPTFATSDASALQSQVASLEAEVARLAGGGGGLAYRPADSSPMALLQGAIFAQRQAERGFKMENYAQKISSLQSQVQRAMSDKQSYTERLGVAKDVERMRTELERTGNGSQLNRLQSTDTRMDIQSRLDTATNQAIAAGRDLQAMQAERDGYNQQWRGQVGQDLTEASRKLSDARENLNKATLRQRLVEMRAPEDSIVQTVAHVSPGSVMQSGEQLMTLVPLNARAGSGGEHRRHGCWLRPSRQHRDREARYLPEHAVWRHRGQGGVCQPRQLHHQPGPARARHDPGHAAGQQGPAFYRSRISLDENKLHDTPAGFRMVPGMPVTVDIKVGKRTMVPYLLSRVLPVAMDGMREP